MKLVHEPTLVYAKENIPKTLTNSIFLAGCTPREKLELEWREEAIQILEKLNYEGTVFLPIDRNRKLVPFDFSRYEEQIDWERQCCKLADKIVFWIPREFRPDFEMLGQTTNVEFGLYFNSNKLMIGSPNKAVANNYLKYLSEKEKNLFWYNNLEELLKDTVESLNPVIRRGVECKIPEYIYSSSQFQNWYQSMKNNNNELVDFEELYSWYMPKAKKLFLSVFKPSVYIKDEDRIKSNEFVVARTDMSYICAYYRPDNEILNSEIVLVKEFRTPVRNESGYVYELVGGSSLKDNSSALETASHELEEEIGLKIEPDRFRFIDSRQSASTLCSHKINLYSVRLTKKEIDRVKEDSENEITHGVKEDTELTYSLVATYRDILEGKYPIDFTNLGMIQLVILDFIKSNVL